MPTSLTEADLAEIDGVLSERNKHETAGDEDLAKYDDMALAERVPALIAEVRRLRALLAEYDARRRGRCDWCGSSGSHEEDCRAFTPP